jgi:hypothetical protein
MYVFVLPFSSHLGKACLLAFKSWCFLIHQDKFCSDLWFENTPFWKMVHVSKANIKQLAAAELNPICLPKTKSNGCIPLLPWSIKYCN